ncbi:PQQ-binding-like beta-propeller repeat protein [Actinoplanes solisilvae]|uniref:outer membrane protein assembly factor BamB family protein n=1 Tax=Actinoplanes solisilvae TaxID=2486853 RepID=UPI000FD779DB|nr:PQQ-binding-like beta-propeller repeat protein [Actinoplanes solisilvae]
MPADLDDFYGSVARQADAIPLAPAAEARRRGRRRNRNSLIAAAAACCVVLAGAAVLARPLRHTDPNPVNPAASPSALPMVGSPIEFGNTVTSAFVVASGDRVFAAAPAGNKIDVVAVDPHTAQVLWKVDGLGGPAAQGEFAGLVAVEQGLLVVIDNNVHVLDPAARSKDAWTFPMGDSDNLVPYENALLHREAETGKIAAYDWRTGGKLWSVDPGGDAPMHLIGVRTAGTERSREAFTDDRVLSVTRSGKVQVRDVRNGNVLRTITPAQPPTQLSALITYDNWLFDGGPADDGAPAGYRVVATDLSSGDSRVLVSKKAGNTFGILDVCGPGRVCVVDQRTGGAAVSAYDVRNGAKAWTTEVPADSSSVSSGGDTMIVGGGDTTVLLDNDGKVLFQNPATYVDWLDDRRLLVMPGTGAGEVSTVGIQDQRVTRLGNVPQRVEACAHTVDRLACPTTTSLNIYNLPG